MIKSHNAIVQANNKVYEACNEVDYQNGVLYFPCYGKIFGKKISRYLETHPELEIVDVTEVTSGSGERGYFVFVKKKE